MLAGTPRCMSAFALQPLPTTVVGGEALGPIIDGIVEFAPYANTQPITTEDVLALAQQLGRLLGPAYPAPDNTTTAADLFSLALIVGLSVGVNRYNLGEAFPNTVYALLDEFEAMLGVSNRALSGDERRTRLLARWRTRFAGTPQAILRALAPLNGGTQPTMRETLARDSTAAPRRVFAFTVRTIYDPNTARSIGPLDDVVQVMKPAHTAVAFTSKSLTGGFFCNDPGSLTNNTVL